jgi:hypothetical protein
MYFTERGDNAQNIPMRTYTPQASTANTACELRAPHIRKPLGYFGCDGLKGYVPFFNHFNYFNHCCVSCAAAQKQSTCKCQGMDLLLAQRSMIRTGQYLNVPSPLFDF